MFYKGVQCTSVPVFMSRPAVEAAVRAAHFVISIGSDRVDINERSIVSVNITCSLEMQVRFLESLEVRFSLFIFGEVHYFGHCLSF